MSWAFTEASAAEWNGQGDELDMGAMPMTALAYAALCVVDNYANGISNQELGYEVFRDLVKANAELVDRLVQLILLRLEDLLGPEPEPEPEREEK